MSDVVLWGTGIAPQSSSLRRRITSEGDVRITSELDVRVASVPPAQVIFIRDTAAGDTRVTSAGDRRVIVNGLSGPQYFKTANVTTDGAEPFVFSYTTNAWQPSAQGGEQVWLWAYVTLSWSMAATVRLTPSVDGDTDLILPVENGVVEIIRSTFQLEQQSGTLQRVSRVFPVPLVRRLMRGNVELFRTAMRGERLQIIVESTGALGVGELMLDGIEVELRPVRKAIYARVDSTP